jgi:hypothetical protein
MLMLFFCVLTSLFPIDNTDVVMPAMLQKLLCMYVKICYALLPGMLALSSSSHPIPLLILLTAWPWPHPVLSLAAAYFSLWSQIVREYVYVSLVSYAPNSMMPSPPEAE